MLTGCNKEDEAASPPRADQDVWSGDDPSLLSFRISEPRWRLAQGPEGVIAFQGGILESKGKNEHGHDMKQS